MRRNTLAHVARGADGALFFQWRASRGGGEKFHSAMLPHGGTETRIWREAVALGANLEALAEIAGSRVTGADTAVLWDWESWWSLEQVFRPSVDLRLQASADWSSTSSSTARTCRSTSRIRALICPATAS